MNVLHRVGEYNSYKHITEQGRQKFKGSGRLNQITYFLSRIFTCVFMIISG